LLRGSGVAMLRSVDFSRVKKIYKPERLELAHHLSVLFTRSLAYNRWSRRWTRTR
jgi:hypothetical protein